MKRNFTTIFFYKTKTKDRYFLEVEKLNKPSTFSNIFIPQKSS